MLTEDYIMRLINQALAVIMAALGLKKAGKYRDALQSFDQAKEILVGLDARITDQLDENALLDKLTSYERLDIERTKLLADVYAEEAEIFKLLGQDSTVQFAYQRSLRLYLESALAKEDIFESEILQKIERIRHNLEVDSLDDGTCLALLDYYDRLLSSSDDYLSSNGFLRSVLQSDYSIVSNKCVTG